MNGWCLKRQLLWRFCSKFCAPGVDNPIFECRSNFAYYFFTLFIRWNERTEAGCIRGVSYREMWWQWHYEAAQSLLTFDSRNDVSIPWRQNWSNSGSAFFKIRRIKFTLNFEITRTVIMVLRTDLRLTAVKRQPSSLFFDKTGSNQIQLQWTELFKALYWLCDTIGDSPA